MGRIIIVKCVSEKRTHIILKYHSPNRHFSLVAVLLRNNYWCKVECVTKENWAIVNSEEKEKIM